MQFTLPEAWADFLAFLKSSGAWADIPKRERLYIYKAGSDLKKGRLGAARAGRLFERYAPGRYEFRQVVVVVG